MQRRQLIRGCREQIDIGVQRLIQSRVQMNLTEAQRPRPGWAKQARQQDSAGRRGHFYSKILTGKRVKFIVLEELGNECSLAL